MIAASAGLLFALIVGGAPGIVGAAPAAAFVLAVLRRREPPHVLRRRARIVADLPFCVDLIVACLRSGSPLSGAVSLAARAVGGPLGERLAWLGEQLRLGAEPEVAWSKLGEEEPALALLTRAMVRATVSGAPSAEMLERLAADCRRSARAGASAAARRVGSQVAAPLGLCFLPAFVLLGIVPIVATLATEVWPG
ncbi:type II secretion system F family protein [Rhizohabitans arisaemae]|uniref:type II secretion system F family protein n=1 Tax=Rhizohabitans arisaemae TaxID=2720610 RepID=UPI0024B26936|nr:type II secretion system F family protein [Rhizohabitans arisaemae]